MEKISPVSTMGDDGTGSDAQEPKPPIARSGGSRVLFEDESGVRPMSVNYAAGAAAAGTRESSSAETTKVFVEGSSEDVLTRRRSGTLPIPGAANSPRQLKPVSIIFAPPANPARFHQPRGLPNAADIVPPRAGARSFTFPCVEKLKWKAMQDMATAWLRNPKNWALLMWVLAVFASGAVLFMVMVGMLNNVLLRKADRDLWFEASNQSINALFTLLVLLLHPLRVLHLVWLLRWHRKDITKLRHVYCKGGLPKPNEWSHMLVVLLLYQLNCFAQYAVCALNWCYTRAERPVVAVVVCFIMALSAGSVAGIYQNLSPLGKAAAASSLGELAYADNFARDVSGKTAALPGSRLLLHSLPKYDRLLERTTSSALGAGPQVGGHVVVENPQWQGGVFNCWEAPSLVAATVCCFPCVLGLNLSRLGFGNRYVHVATFLLACFAPFVIFEMAAINVDSREYRRFLRGCGIVVSVCGLLYGGFWRIRMRETYGLPAETWCHGYPKMSDFARWLLCSACSLCQEVRTAEAFDIIDNRFHVKVQRNGPPPLGPDMRHPPDGEEGSFSSLGVAASTAASLQPLPESTVVRITDFVLPSIRDPRLDPPLRQDVFHS